MKKLLAAAGLGAAIAIGSLAGAGTASAYSDETYFLDLQVSHGWTIWDPAGWTIWDPAGHVAKARYTCSQLEYRSGYDVANELYYANGPWDRSGSQVFVQDSATALCPWTW